jgi:hypothetical protein
MITGDDRADGSLAAKHQVSGPMAQTNQLFGCDLEAGRLAWLC